MESKSVSEIFNQFMNDFGGDEKLAINLIVLENGRYQLYANHDVGTNPEKMARVVINILDKVIRDVNLETRNPLLH